MIFSARAKAPSPAASRRPLPPGRGEEGIVLATASPLPSGERSAAQQPGEGAFPKPDCPIWHDITRALDVGGAT
jgi:hypothetical protein